jgi:hypothetical protein
MLDLAALAWEIKAPMTATGFGPASMFGSIASVTGLNSSGLPVLVMYWL